ncbi:MAG: septum site-determining protein MinC [Proteobacteria bacterium]|nr:septum site-determining protein MinC [Pseudomonadota bacterium]MCP4921870.1 septum site-determining protein MinC [Pseudomonadota bacterium]
MIGLSAQDGVLLLTLDPKASFEAWRQAVRDMFGATPDRFRGKDARLDFGTRAIDLFDLRRLVHVLKDEFGVSVTGLYCTQENLVRYAERELKLRIYPRLPEPVEVEEPEAEEPEAATEVEVELDDEPEERPAIEPQRKTLVMEKGLRSGQVIRHTGDVMIYGDVNPGAEVTATGNVVVFGRLEGMVHAGSEGDDESHILAFDLRPAQLRIGCRIAFSRGSGTTPLRPTYQPELAWVEGTRILIEPYQGRLPQK